MNFRYETIIPVRNGGQALVNSIESVLSSTSAHRPFLTISDNFSTDGSPWKEVLSRFPPEQWRVITPPKAMGRVEHWSWAFAQAQSPWVKPLMTGDRVESNFWDWAESVIAEHPEAGLLSCGGMSIDPGRGHPEEPAPSPRSEWNSTIYGREDFLRDSVRCLNRVGSLSQVLVRGDVLRAALPFETEFPWTADWRFYKRCVQQAPGVLSRARLARLDRSIARLSTSWKGVRGSFAEEWRFAGEQAALANESFWRSFFLRSRVIGAKMSVVLGRKVLPRQVRAGLTTVTGLHRKAAPKAP